MPKSIVYVNTSKGVGILHAIDSRYGDGKFHVMLNGKLERFQQISRISEGEYNEKKDKTVATTKKPARGKK